jgi:small conductance mechanosensitive channel
MMSFMSLRFRLLLLIACVLVLFITTHDISAQPASTQLTQPATQPGVAIDPVQQGFWQLLTSGQGEFDIRQALQPRYWVQFTQDAITWTISFIPRVISAVFLLIVFWLIYRTIRKIIIGGMKTAGVDESIRDMLSMLLKWFILGFGFIIAGNQIGIQIAALLTGVSIIGLAIGFAAQDTISNFISGIMIFWDKPFKVGDWIVVYGQMGQVRRITFRSTRLVNLDGDVVIFPNSKMLSETVINKTTNPITRCNVSVGIAYKESIDNARSVLLRLVNSDTRIEKSPAPEVVVVSLGASSVDLMLHFWIREERYEDAMQYEYTERAKVALDDNGIEIPFPHLQLLTQNPPPVT